MPVMSCLGLGVLVQGLRDFGQTDGSATVPSTPNPTFDRLGNRNAETTEVHKKRRHSLRVRFRADHASNARTLSESRARGANELFILGNRRFSGGVISHRRHGPIL